MAAVVEHGTPRVDDLRRLDDVEAVGVDETAFAAAWATRSTSFVTGIVDVTRRRGGSARLLERDRRPQRLSAGELGEPARPWLASRDRGGRVGPLPRLRQRAALPSTTRVLDALHVVRLGFAVVDQVRQRIQREQTGHRGRTGDPLYGIRRLLRRAADHHSQRSWARLLAGLDAGDTPDEQLARTWIAAGGPATDLPQSSPRPRRAGAVPVAVLLRRRRHPRAHPPSDHHRLLTHRTTGLLRHRRPLEWTHRSDQPINQKDQARRPRIPQLRQLPAPPPAALRRRLGHYPRHPDQRPATTLSGVEPVF